MHCLETHYHSFASYISRYAVLFIYQIQYFHKQTRNTKTNEQVRYMEIIFQHILSAIRQAYI